MGREEMMGGGCVSCNDKNDRGCISGTERDTPPETRFSDSDGSITLGKLFVEFCEVGKVLKRILEEISGGGCSVKTGPPRNMYFLTTVGDTHFWCSLLDSGGRIVSTGLIGDFCDIRIGVFWGGLCVGLMGGGVLEVGRVLP